MWEVHVHPEKSQKHISCLRRKVTSKNVQLWCTSKVVRRFPFYRDFGNFGWKYKWNTRLSTGKFQKFQGISEIWLSFSLETSPIKSAFQLQVFTSCHKALSEPPFWIFGRKRERMQPGAHHATDISTKMSKNVW